MPNVGYDAQSFQIDGRRIWLVSGAIHYARTPRELWRRRIRAAKQAGLNCVETYVFWNLHEKSPGVFDFEGDKDLRAFVQTIHEEGLYCILRPGPYVCAEWDFGGLPAWLHRIPNMKLREANGPFLEACSRYLSAVMEQVKGLQVSDSLPSGPGSAGPILMVQAENEWICHNPDQAETYLRELVRYLRENGCTVPINVCNNLWQRVEGTIDTWNANQHLAGDLRQLRVVQPNAPRIVTEFWPGWFDRWGGEHHTEFTADWNVYRLAQILASGAQYNLYMFHGGTNFAFFGGRTICGPDCFMTTSYDYDAPLREAGGRGEKYLAIKRVSTFASHFGHVFAGLDPNFTHAAIATDDDGHGLSVIHQRGAQGQIIFILKGAKEKATETKVLLANGLTLPVPLGDDRAAWVLVDAKLGASGTLTYSSLRPWACIAKRLLVLFGPAGAQGLVSINDSPWTVTVPTDRTPLIERHEGFTVVVLNNEMVDAAYATASSLVIGAGDFDDHDRPLPLKDWSHVTVITADGQVKRTAATSARPPQPPRLGKWEQAGVDTFIDGSNEAFKTVEGPASLEALKCDFGYGWYRINLKKPKAGNAFSPRSGDRLHVFTDGKPAALLGLGAGATFDPVKLRLGETSVVLADNLGRFNFGWSVGEQKGLVDHLYDVKPMRLGKPKVESGMSPDPFELRGFWTYLRRGERRAADAWVWKISGGRRTLMVDIRGLPARVMLRVNGVGVAMYDNHFTAGYLRHVITPAQQSRGKNEIRLALFDKLDPKAKLDPLKHVTIYEVSDTLTEKAEWAFTPWSVPGGDAFGTVSQRGDGTPAWFRARFNANGGAVPLWLEPIGMSKGQIYLNGHNVGRYFVATASGQAVPPQERYYLPEPWLNQGENELLLFDEHGKRPGKCRLVYDTMGPYGA